MFLATCVKDNFSVIWDWFSWEGGGLSRTTSRDPRGIWNVTILGTCAGSLDSASREFPGLWFECWSFLCERHYDRASPVRRPLRRPASRSSSCSRHQKCSCSCSLCRNRNREIRSFGHLEVLIRINSRVLKKWVASSATGWWDRRAYFFSCSVDSIQWTVFSGQYSHTLTGGDRLERLEDHIHDSLRGEHVASDHRSWIGKAVKISLDFRLWAARTSFQRESRTFLPSGLGLSSEFVGISTFTFFRQPWFSGMSWETMHLRQ